MESKFVEINGVRLNYGEGAGNGPRLVFLPGFPRYWTEYRPVLDALEPQYHLFALSMRGQGRSERSPPYTISSYIDDTAVFLREVVGRSALGIGHSAGAWFGLAAANDDPDLFSAFVSIDQPLDPADHVIAHGADTSSVQRMLDAMRAASGVEDLRLRLAALPAAGGGTWADEMSVRELGDRAAHLAGIDPETFAPWAEGIEEWLLVPELQRKIMAVGTYIVATEPLGPERAGALIRDNLAVADVNFVLDYYRLSADHRTISGLRAQPRMALA